MIELINAPSILGLKPTGVERLPQALHNAGLTKKLAIQTSKTILPPAYSTYRDDQTNMLNSESIAEYSVTLADAVQKVVQAGNFPLVLGGDCSNIIGNMLALKRLGRYGLFFLDGHADFYQPAASQTGEAADMDLALVTGRGPDIITNIENRRPLVQDTDVVQFGQRDKQETVLDGSQQIADTDIHVFELETIRKNGVEKTCRTAIETLLTQPIKGVWVHIDCDVLDDDEMPAVDYRLAGGLTFAELQTIIDLVMSTHKVVGLDLAIYNPNLDPDKKLALKLVDLLSNTLKRQAVNY